MKKISLLLMGIILGNMGFSAHKENDETPQPTHTLASGQWPFLSDPLLDTTDPAHKLPDQKPLTAENRGSDGRVPFLGGKGLVVKAKNFKPMALHPASQRSLP
ncbi:MAG: hypothetical protein ACK5PQ_02500 [Alphaproteobacteria bacterium]